MIFSNWGWIKLDNKKYEEGEGVSSEYCFSIWYKKLSALKSAPSAEDGQCLSSMLSCPPRSCFWPSCGLIRCYRIRTDPGVPVVLVALDIWRKQPVLIPQGVAFSKHSTNLNMWSSMFLEFQVAKWWRKVLGLVQTCCLDLIHNRVVKMYLAFFSLKALNHFTWCAAI